MKLLKLWVVFLLFSPLYLSAAMLEEQSTKTKNIPTSQTKNSVENKMVEPDMEKSKMMEPDMEKSKMMEPDMEKSKMMEPDMEKSKMVEPDMEKSKMVEPDMEKSKMVEPDMEKSFDNSIKGSQQFVKSMLDLVYLELPKKSNNQEVFDYLSLVTTKYFAFTYMSKWTAGRETIKYVSSDLQQKYLESSKLFMILLYGEIFNTYYKQYIYRLGEVERKSDTQYDIKMRVESKTQDARNQDAILNVIWKVKYSTKEKKFFVIDVDVNGIVFLSTQKKQFTDMMQEATNKLAGNNPNIELELDQTFSAFIDLLDSKNVETQKRLGITLS